MAARHRPRKIVGSLSPAFEPIPDTKKIIVISKIASYDVIEARRGTDSEEKAGPVIVELRRRRPLRPAQCHPTSPALATLNRTRAASPYQALANPTAASGREAPSGGGDTAGTITPWWTRTRNTTEKCLPATHWTGHYTAARRRHPCSGPAGVLHRHPEHDRRTRSARHAGHDQDRHR